MNSRSPPPMFLARRASPRRPSPITDWPRLAPTLMPQLQPPATPQVSPMPQAQFRQSGARPSPSKAFKVKTTPQRERWGVSLLEKCVHRFPDALTKDIALHQDFMLRRRRFRDTVHAACGAAKRARSLRYRRPGRGLPQTTAGVAMLRHSRPARRAMACSAAPNQPQVGPFSRSPGSAASNAWLRCIAFGVRSDDLLRERQFQLIALPHAPDEIRDGPLRLRRLAISSTSHHGTPRG